MSRRILHRAALALALLAAGGQFFNISHLLMVPHAICAEHGELVHVDTGPRSTRHDAHAARDSASSAYRPGAIGSTDPHDHCLISVFRKQTLAIHPAGSVLLPPRISPAVVSFENVIAPPRTVAILHLAPKSSPPHLA
jgi:hypothetical protein